MEYSYAVSTLEATAVTMSVVCHLKASSFERETHLILAKGNILEIYSFTEHGLVKLLTTPVFGRITALDKYQPGDLTHDVLFILTERKYFCILSYDEQTKSMMTRAKGNLKDQVGRSLEQGQRGIIDPEGRMVGMMLYDGLLKVLPIEPNGGLKEAFNVRIEELRHIDFNFLYGYPRPTLCLLYEDNRGSRHIVTHTVDLRERELVEGPWSQTNVEFGARILVPVPSKYGGGVVLIGQSTITFLSHPVARIDTHSRSTNVNSHSGTVIQTSVGISRTHITSYCHVDSDDVSLCRYLLGDQFGNLSVLMIHLPGSSSPTLLVEPLGVTSIAETISHLGNGIVFIGSSFGDSQLVKLHRDPPTSTSESVIEELERYPNIGPILDLCFLRNGNVGQVVTCSGGYKDGSLRIIKSGIGITEQASIEIQGIKGLWNILIPITSPATTTSSSPRFQSYLVQSYTWETRALTLSNPEDKEGDGEMNTGEEISEMVETEIGGFDHSLPTLFCQNLVSNLIVQVTPTSVRLIKATTLTLVQEYSCTPHLTGSPSSKIFQATGNALQLALALSNGEVILLELDQIKEELVIMNRLTFEQDIACLCFKTDHLPPNSDLGSFSNTKVDLLVVGLWTDHSVRVHAVPSLEEVARVVLGGEETAQARNVVLAPLSSSSSSTTTTSIETKEDNTNQLSSHLHLLVGLGDGTLIIYLLLFPLAGLPTISNKQEIRLGTHPVSLSCFANKGTLCVFAGCDQPTILFSRQTNDQLLYSHVNICNEDITSVTPFFHPSFVDCLALASDSTLILGNFDSLQRVHISSYPLGEAPHHITHHISTSTLAVCTSRIEQTPRGEESSDRVLFFDQSSLTIEASYDLELYESGMSICSCFLKDSEDSTTKEYLVVGTAFVLPEEQQPTRGRLLVFELLSDNEKGGRIVRLVVETPTRGAAFSLSSLNGKLVAGIDSKIQIYRFSLSGEDGSSSPEMILECGHHGHILALYLKCTGDLILVGDLLRSICVLRYRERDSLIEELARDFNSNLMRAVEIWNENYFIGAEDQGNLFIMRTPQNSKSEEERSRLEVLTGYHIGDFVNAITKGTLSRTVALVSQPEEVPEKSRDSNKLDSLLLGTVSGRLCSLFPLTREEFNFLTILERCLLQVVKTLNVGGLAHEEWRSFFHERRGKHQGYDRKTVDGDIIERFLDLTEPMMEMVTKSVNDEILYLSRQGDESNDEKSLHNTAFVPVTLRELVQKVEDLTRMH